MFSCFALAFAIAAGRAMTEPGLRWPVLAGIAAGLAVATKETSVIVLPSSLVACAIAWWSLGPDRRRAPLADGRWPSPPLLVWRRQQRSRRSSTRHFSRTQAASSGRSGRRHIRRPRRAPRRSRAPVALLPRPAHLVGVRGPDVDRRGCARAGRRRRGDYVEGASGATSRATPPSPRRSSPPFPQDPLESAAVLRRNDRPRRGRVFGARPCKRVPCGACHAGGRALDRGRSPRVAGLARGGDLCIGPANPYPRAHRPGRRPHGDAHPPTGRPASRRRANAGDGHRAPARALAASLVSPDDARRLLDRTGRRAGPGGARHRGLDRPLKSSTAPSAIATCRNSSASGPRCSWRFTSNTGCGTASWPCGDGRRDAGVRRHRAGVPALRSRTRCGIVADGERAMTPPELALVVPCYNEAERLDPEAFLQFVATHPGVQLVLVDDGSQDATGEILERMRAAAPASVTTLRHSPTAARPRPCGPASSRGSRSVRHWSGFRRRPGDAARGDRRFPGRAARPAGGRVRARLARDADGPRHRAESHTPLLRPGVRHRRVARPRPSRAIPNAARRSCVRTPRQRRFSTRHFQAVDLRRRADRAIRGCRSALETRPPRPAIRARPACLARPARIEAALA